MSEYIFEKNAEDRELARLKLVEAAVDPETISLLDRAGIAAGWTCVELGAGAGSIAEWMGRQVGTDGLVLAVDKKTLYLDRSSSPPYQVLNGDFLSLDIVPAVDLLHGRYVLVHNAQAQTMLEKVKSIVKPGGLVLLEEPDFTCAWRLNPSSDASQHRVNEAICRMFSNAGLDPSYGLHLPERATEAGLTIEEVKATMHLCRGDQPISRLMAESALVLRKEYTCSGPASDEDVDRYVALAHDSAKWCLYYSTISMLARVS